MKKFEYKEIDYDKFPTIYELNQIGEEGWEMINVFQFQNKIFDYDICEYVLEDKIKITFKREIVNEK